MKSIIALTCAGWLSAPAGLPSNVAPLAFGMTVQDVSEALRTPLTYVSGRPGSEIYSAVTPAGVPGFYRVDQRVYLQFRKGCLSGWKNDWRLQRGLL
jgi:hypothetical protein